MYVFIVIYAKFFVLYNLPVLLWIFCEKKFEFYRKAKLMCGT